MLSGVFNILLFLALVVRGHELMPLSVITQEMGSHHPPIVALKLNDISVLSYLSFTSH